MQYFNDVMNILDSNTTSFLWMYITLFIISFFDTLIVVGAFFPASFFVIAAGFFSIHTGLDIWISIIVITLGGLIGDLLSYFIGLKGLNWFKGEKKLLKASYLDKGGAFFEKYGDKSIIIGRFLGIIKSIIPFVAGLYKMKFKKFLFLNIVAGLIWTIAHIVIGYILGRTLDVLNISKSVKLLIILIPFGLFFAWTLFEYRKKIFHFLINKKNIQN